jgi:hypothetical protein
MAMYQRAGGEPLAVAAVTFCRSILDPCRAVSGALTPRGRPCSSCCLCSPAACARPHHPSGTAEYAASLERATRRHRLHHCRWTRAATPYQQRKLAHRQSQDHPGWRPKCKCPSTWELTGFVRCRPRCIPTTPLAGYGWRAVKSARSRSNSSLRSGGCGSMIVASDRYAKTSRSESTARSTQLQPECV